MIKKRTKNRKKQESDVDRIIGRVGRNQDTRNRVVTVGSHLKTALSGIIRELMYSTS